MKESKEYYAFISYKREDEDVAKWLQNFLADYHFPTAINGSSDLPEKIHPTFRDVTDLTPGILSEEIEKALRKSEWLIVICSPRSAKSPWVCKEAQTFIDWGLADHIIPFIIEGTPFSGNQDTECYPESLLNLTGEYELLAANINESGKSAAALKVIARMFNLKFNVLYDWYDHKRKKIRNIWITLISILTITIGMAVMHMRPIHEYYADFIECNGRPQGFEKITKQIVRHRYVSYKFIYRRDKLFDSERNLKKVVRINSHGNPTVFYGDFTIPIDGEMKNIYPIIEISNSGITFYDVMNNLREQWDYSTSITSEGMLLISDIKRFSVGNEEDIHKLITERHNKSNYNRVCYELDENRYPKRMTYHNSSSSNLMESVCENNLGAYGYDIERDSTNRIISISVLNVYGKPDSDKYHGHQIRYNHTKWGPQSVSVFDLHGHAIRYDNLMNVHKVHNTYDKYGNVIETTCHDIDSSLCNNKWGVAKQTIKLKNGCVVESTDYDYTGKRGNNTAFMTSRTVSVYNSKGRLIQDVFYDTCDQISPNIDGAAIVEYKYNHDGALVKKSYFNEKYQPTISKLSGYSTLVQKVNAKGQVIHSTCLGVHGEKTNNRTGFCSQITEYNRLGMPCKFKLYDKEGNPVVCKDGWSVQESEIINDLNGNTQYVISTYGKNLENVIETNILSHRVIYTYNEVGECIEESYLGTDQKPCNNKFGYAKCKYTYDKHGRLSTRSYYDHKGNLTPVYTHNTTMGGFAKDSLVYLSNNRGLIYRFNDNSELGGIPFWPAIELRELKGDTLLVINYDKNFNKVIAQDGFAIKLSVSNEFYKPTDVLYFNEDSVRCYNYEGISRKRLKYDKRGNNTECAFYDVRDSLLNVNGQGAMIRYEFDNRNNEIKRFHLDERGNQLLDKTSGFVTINSYDQMDRVIESFYVDTLYNPYVSPDKLYSSKITEYDIHGDVVKEAFYRGTTPIECAQGFHSIEFDYDAYHRIKQMCYMNTAGQRTSVNGIHRVSKSYHMNKVEEEKYYNDNDEYIGKINYIYDDYGYVDYLLTHYQALNITQKQFQRLALYENNGNDIFIIINWGKWDISRPLNYYLESLLILTKFTPATVLTYNVKNNSYVYKEINKNSNLDKINIPDDVYANLLWGQNFNGID